MAKLLIFQYTDLCSIHRSLWNMSGHYNKTKLIARENVAKPFMSISPSLTHTMVTTKVRSLFYK